MTFSRYIRQFVVLKRGHGLCLPSRSLSGTSGAPDSALKPPKFADLMRTIYKRAHPDLLRAKYPKEAENNSDSLQVINSILTTIKSFNSFPPQIVKQIPLVLLPEGGNGDKELVYVRLSIKTAGGECRNSLTSSFTDLFLQAGLLDQNVENRVDNRKLKGKKKGKKAKKAPLSLFEWNAEYFPEVPTGNEEVVMSV